jgi:hypothetical protein
MSSDPLSPAARRKGIEGQLRASEELTAQLGEAVRRITRDFLDGGPEGAGRGAPLDPLPPRLVDSSRRDPHDAL